ncbi:MAG: integrase arm-type DNA-binding domain-containing protein [Roseococcus sp.]
MASTAIEAEKAKPRAATYRLSFSDGLLLEVRPVTKKSPAGTKAWIVRVQLDGKRRDVGLGAYPLISLAEARRKAAAMRELAQGGVDPLMAKRRSEVEAAARRREEEEQAKNVRTFRDVAERLVTIQAPGWTSAKTVASWKLTMNKWAYPALGDLPIAEIGREQVVQALTPIWTTQPATARKLQRRISATLDYAAANGWRAADNPAAGRVLRLTKALPSINANGRRWPSLAWAKVPAFLAALDKQQGIAPLALRFAALCALRSNEIRQARWDEMDFAAGVWTIPGHRMKNGKLRELPPHRVPISQPMRDVLCRAMVAVTAEECAPDALAAHAALRGDVLVFPNGNGEALSDAALGACIKRMNKGRTEDAPAPWRDVDGRPVTAHGLRRSFRSWVDDERPEDAAAAEKQLAHDEPNKVSAAYRGSDLLARRVMLMAAWGSFVTTPPAAKLAILADARKRRAKGAAA